jgi:hypothetical protein
MPKTNTDNVRDELRATDAIQDVSILNDAQLTTIGIDPANLEVSEDIEPETDYSDERLELIERYLAVHYILTSGIDEVRRVGSKSLDDGTSYDYGDHESYRERAKRLDTDGILDSRSKPNALVDTPDSRNTRTRR